MEESHELCALHAHPAESYWDFPCRDFSRNHVSMSLTELPSFGQHPPLAPGAYYRASIDADAGLLPWSRRAYGGGTAAGHPRRSSAGFTDDSDPEHLAEDVLLGELFFDRAEGSQPPLQPTQPAAEKPTAEELAPRSTAPEQPPADAGEPPQAAGGPGSAEGGLLGLRPVPKAAAAAGRATGPGDGGSGAGSVCVAVEAVDLPGASGSGRLSAVVKPLWPGGRPAVLDLGRVTEDGPAEAHVDAPAGLLSGLHPGGSMMVLEVGLKS